LKDIASRPSCDEVLLFVRPQAKTRIEQAGTSTVIEADVMHLLSTADADLVTVHSEDTATYVVIAYAGKSPANS